MRIKAIRMASVAFVLVMASCVVLPGCTTASNSGSIAEGSASASGGRVDSSNEFQVNSKGQTFGTIRERADGTVEQAELVRVEATNGQIGYISVIQMETAAMIGAEHTADNAAKALCASAKERYGWDVIDFDEARDVVITATLGNGRERSFQAFAQYVGSRVGLELEVTEDDFQAIFDDARKAVAVTIPVYEEDGETVIGEYIVNRL